MSHYSIKAEYRSLANATAEVIWLESLLQELRIEPPRTPLLWCDNLSFVAIFANPVFHSKSKHFELDLHFVRERVLHKILGINHVPTTELVADALTKPLSANNFLKFKHKLTVENPIQFEGKS